LPFVGAAERVQTRDFVEWLLAGLTDRERDVMAWRYFEGLSMDVVADRLRTTRPAAYQLHYRALAKLRDRAKKVELGR
jgi:RNA polymerase sigma factor (sigma-70 family)